MTRRPGYGSWVRRPSLIVDFLMCCPVLVDGFVLVASAAATR
jgi:hypothetical protein